MSGIYLHIPFCRKACRYCDFCFIVSLKYLDEYLSSLKREISFRKGEVYGPVKTVYFGGGTPSVMNASQISSILELLYRTFPVTENAEITLEANPDDLSSLYLKELKQIGINRLSIGVQSFRDEDLLLMNRSHDALQSEKAVWAAAEAGLENINLDLIYGIPGLSIADWEQNILKAIKLPVKHLSAYHLTYEKDTIFYKWLSEGRVSEIKESESVRQYEDLVKITGKEGFDHYEVSNFSLPGYHSQHNMVYWTGKHYIGFGASAHSYDGKGRQWNLGTVRRYIEAIQKEVTWYKREELNVIDRYHDYLVTRLRMNTGILFSEVSKEFGSNQVAYIREKAQPFLNKKNPEIILDNSGLKITSSGWLRLDTITRALMIDSL